MIVDGLLSLLAALLGGIAAVLPDWAMPDFSDEALTVSGYVLAADAIVPFADPLVGVLNVYMSTFAGLLLYRVGLFVYKRVRG